MHRDTALIGTGLVVAIILGALLITHDKSAQTRNTQPAAVSFAVLHEGEQSGEIATRVNYRIRNEDEFASLWLALHSDDSMPVPVVDFEAHDVLAVFEGERPSAGYDISIVSVMDQGDGTLAVTILHEEPGATCITNSVITSPFELVVVPKLDLKISREDLTTTRECE